MQLGRRCENDGLHVITVEALIQILRGMLDAALLGKGLDIVWFAANNGHYFSTLNISQGVEVFPSEGTGSTCYAYFHSETS